MNDSKNPRVLVITPEVAFLPQNISTLSSGISAKAGGLGDVSASLIQALFDQGADVHVALPHYRTMFGGRYGPLAKFRCQAAQGGMPIERVHLAEDRIFFYRNHVYSNHYHTNLKIALTFQREVINNIIPFVQPDLIHCSDWMTALIPAMARKLGIASLFTFHNFHSIYATLAQIEDTGIDTAFFWQNLYYRYYPDTYENMYVANPVDFLVSGIFSAHFVNTVSPSFLMEMVEGRHDFVVPALREELDHKWKAGCATGILNAPDPSFNPETDPEIAYTYGSEDHPEQKRKNKRFLQHALGLTEDESAPLFFWPSRLDGTQKGCQLLAEILYEVISRYWKENLQIMFVADGEYQAHFRDIVAHHGFWNRVAVCHFNDSLARQAYAAADFVLMPSRFEPCGLPQMIGAKYGCLPVAHDIGGIHDTVRPLNVAENTGNGFLFEIYDANGLLWAMDQAMDFHVLPGSTKNPQIGRVMQEAAVQFNHEVTARQYMDIYERMLHRPLIKREMK
jgi:starch synthase